MGGLLRALEVTGGVAGSHTQAAPPGKQVPSRGPQAWHQLPLANTSSTCGEPCASQALGWGPVPGSPKRQDFCLWNGGRLKVRLWGPRAEPSRVQRSKKLRRASWRRGYGREWPQSAPCGSPQPKWLRPLGDNAVGVYPRLHSHQARSPSAGWRPATPDGPAPPTELQTAASRCLRPGTASLHHPGAPPGPRRGPSVGASQPWCPPRQRGASPPVPWRGFGVPAPKIRSFSKYSSVCHFSCAPTQRTVRFLYLCTPASFPQRANAAIVSVTLQPVLDVRCLVPPPRPRTEDAQGSSFWGLTRHQGPPD
ncbi:uncharacterized protein LOC122703340 isoform X2 [Cervus elaphus]|uniref:uncharacterized protein LOC122703340 isoform X2 n=1 Tax=Cervus elaphus TaxID=9860 RepID=UPI001CC2F37C|nr:uncharacterized protein LOC122703340 isoform X2 [Cervus elaphus]